MKKRAACFLVALLLSLLAGPLLAETAPAADNKLPEGFSNWSIQFYFGGGHASSSVPNDANSNLGFLLFSSAFTGTSSSSASLSPLMLYSLMQPAKVQVKGKSGGTDFKAEYRPKHFGFEFGLSTWNVKMEEPAATSIGNQLIPLLVLATPTTSSSSSSSSSFLLFMSLLSGASSSAEPVGGAVTTFDFAFKLHARPHDTVDPYFGIGLGIGQCGLDCNVGKAFAKLGIRLNLGGGFMFLEAEPRYYGISIPVGSGKKYSLNVRETYAFTGFGLYL